VEQVNAGVSGSIASELVATARALAADGVCAEVVAAWRAEGIEPVLLKGPTVAEWLYPGDVRSYVDIDLLVAPSRVLDAAAVLIALGFDAVDHHVSLHAHPWVRAADGAEVDLHVTLWGPSRPAESVWRELQRWLEWWQVGPVNVQALNLPARALHVVLHAAQHADSAKPRQDLVRALVLTPGPTWSEAEELAHRLWALTPMADGLLLEADGERLLERLPLARAAAIGTRERAPLAIGFTRLAAAVGWRAKLAVLVRALIRPRDELGLGLGPAPERGLGMFVAYGRRFLRLVAATPRTIIAMRRARRRAR
jgi:hypothetical protein